METKRPRNVNTFGTVLKTLEASSNEVLRVYPWKDDIEKCQIALALFNNSRFQEAEKLLKPSYNTLLYHTLGSAVLNFMRALLTFEPVDISIANQQLTDAAKLAVEFRSGQLTPVERSRTSSVNSSYVGSIWGALSGLVKGQKGIEHLKYHELHAELVYAEANMLKSLLSIMSDQSGFVTVVKEAWNIRTTYYVYKEFGEWINRVDELRQQDETDEEAGEGDMEHIELDEHIRSGVLFGLAMFNLTLSFLPSKVMKLIEFVGFSGNRMWALQQLELIGGWQKEMKEESYKVDIGRFEKIRTAKSVPSSEGNLNRDDIDPLNAAVLLYGEERVLIPPGGMLRPLCDYALLMYHTLIGVFIELPDTNLPFATNMLNVMSQYYPNGFLIHYFGARVCQQRKKLLDCIKTYEKAISVQQDWRQFHHVCFWELGNCEASRLDFAKASQYFALLCKESNWSKCVYFYVCAAYLLQHGQRKDLTEVSKMMEQIPELRQKVAGKSIPIEKFVSRKARQFAKQSCRLFMPGFEMLMVWNCFEAMPADVLVKALERAQFEMRGRISLHKEIAGNDPNFVDDRCLALMVIGILNRELFLQALDKEAGNVSNGYEMLANSKTYLEHCVQSFKKLFDIGVDIVLDHYLVPFGRYEYSKLFLCQGKYTEAREQLSFATEGGWAKEDVPDNFKKVGKISLENTLNFRVYNALAKVSRMESQKMENESK